MPHSSADTVGQIIACAKRALQGETPTRLLQYSFQFDKVTKIIVFKAEVAEHLTEDESESLAAIETEIYADYIFGDDTQIETRIEVVSKGAPLNPLSGGIAYRKEG